MLALVVEQLVVVALAVVFWSVSVLNDEDTRGASRYRGAGADNAGSDAGAGDSRWAAIGGGIRKGRGGASNDIFCRAHVSR